MVSFPCFVVYRRTLPRGGPAQLRGVQALQAYMQTPRFVCLGDVVALPIEAIPLLGPVGGGSDGDGKERSIQFVKVVGLTAWEGWHAHKAEVRSHSDESVCWLCVM